MASSEATDLTGAVRGVLGETGAMGATVRQIASRLDDRAERIAEVLDTLRSRGDVLQMGRGLFVLRAFERLAEREDFVDPAAFVERFERENGISLGRYAGPITFRSNETLPVHRWWPYVQGYSAEFVAGVLTAADLARGATVLDPFAGSGTTLVEARRAGAHAVGTELLAPAVLAARVKTHFELDSETLTRAAGRVLRRAEGRNAGKLPFLRETRRQFAPRALADLTRLRDALPPEGDPTADAVRLAFGRILIPSSRLHRSPCLGYGKRSSDSAVPVFERFRSAVTEMSEDLSKLSNEASVWGPPAEVVPRDARVGSWPARSVHLAVTSPPYVNGMDYVMNYKVDLAWLGYARSVLGPRGPATRASGLRQPAATRDRPVPRHELGHRPVAFGDPVADPRKPRAQGNVPSRRHARGGASLLCGPAPGPRRGLPGARSRRTIRRRGRRFVAGRGVRAGGPSPCPARRLVRVPTRVGRGGPAPAKRPAAELRAEGVDRYARTTSRRPVSAASFLVEGGATVPECSVPSAAAS